MRASILPTVAVVLLAVTAGCAAFGPGDAGAQTAPPWAENQPDSTTNQADDVGPTDGAASFQRPSIQVGAAYDNYSALYDATIDSVVEIRAETARGESQGSGFVYQGDGYVVTNQHVVGDAESVSVGFATGVWRTGAVVGTDVYTDLAVVRVDSVPDSVDPLPLAEAAPDPGQPVAAMGSPLGFEGSITQGIVSGINRSMPVAGGFSIPDTVQTDAAMNPGNSGGPLVSMDGAVVGVNRATAGDNIGFAISAAVVERVATSLAENGTYPHSYLGVRSVPVTPGVAEANDLDTTRGVMVVDTVGGGPTAGVLQPADRQRGSDGQPTFVGGDVIVGMGNQSITSQHDLARYLLLETRPGQSVEVTVVRDGQRTTETVTLAQRPAPETDQSV